MTTIDPETLKEQVENSGDVCVIDIRPEDDYNENHIEGSENRPIRKKLLAGNVEEALAELDDLPDDKELVMVCDAGVASTETARVLQDRGREASALEGGLNAWNHEQEEQ
jgi:rhodanese-related sulfurtransferase